MAFDRSNPDHLATLRDLIRADPTLLAHADAGRDNQVAPHFAADSGQKIDRASIPNDELLAAVYRDGDEWTGEQTTELALLLVPSSVPMGGDIPGKLDALLADKGNGKAAFEAIRKRALTVAEVAFGAGSTITTADVSAALRPDRPSGKVDT